jgi:RHS repeat-associated protein
LQPSQCRPIDAGTNPSPSKANGSAASFVRTALTTRFRERQSRRRVPNPSITTLAPVGNLRHAELPDGTDIETLVDGEGHRVWKRRNGANVQGFLYRSALQPAAELDGSGSVVARFVYGMGRNVPELMIKGGVTYRILTDHLGSPRLVVNTATGAVAQRMEFDEFGRVLVDTSPGFTPFGFAGGLYDRDTGLVRFGARDYDPEAGRWTARDLILFGGGQANLYSYAANDPVNVTDPSGLILPAIMAGFCVAGGCEVAATVAGWGGRDANCGDRWCGCRALQ